MGLAKNHTLESLEQAETKRAHKNHKHSLRQILVAFARFMLRKFKCGVPCRFEAIVRASLWQRNAKQTIVSCFNEVSSQFRKEGPYQDWPLLYPFHHFLSLLWSCFSPGSA